MYICVGTHRTINYVLVVVVASRRVAKPRKYEYKRLQISDETKTTSIYSYSRSNILVGCEKRE